MLKKHQKKFKIKKDDQVIVITGKYRGKIGKVLKMDLENDRALVQGVNVVKKHQKQTASTEAGIIEKELPIHISNLSHIDPEDQKAVRVGYRLNKESNKKERFSKRSGKVING